MKNHYRIIIKGGYGLYNFGDDALMVAAYHVARNVFATDEIAFLCWDAPYIYKLIPEAHIIPINDVAKKTQTDILLYGGGTQFYSFPLSRIRLLKIEKIKNLLLYLFRPHAVFEEVKHRIKKSPELIAHNRSAALGIGLGPFESSSIEEKRTQRLLKKMEFVAVRDPISAKLCQSWGINSFIHGTDLCYLPNLWDIDRSKKNDHSLSPSFEKIGVIVRDWKHNIEGMAYFEKIFHLIHELRRKNKKVNFILFKKFDIEWLDRLEERGENSIVWDPDSNNINEFLEILSGFDAFITARYHGAVFASLLGKPSLCIAIEPKLEIIADQLKNLAAVWRTPYDNEKALRMIQQLEINAKSLDAVIELATQRAVQMSQNCIAYLKCS